MGTGKQEKQIDRIGNDAHHRARPHHPEKESGAKTQLSILHGVTDGTGLRAIGNIVFTSPTSHSGLQK
jgi:hypothetical protein